MSKTSVLGIATDYFGTLRNQEKDRASVADIFVQIVIPILIGAGVVLFNKHVTETSGLVAAIAIVASLMCSVAVLLFQMRSQPPPSLTHRQIELHDETFSDVMWAIVVGFVTTAVLVVGAQGNWFGDPIYGRYISGLVGAIAIHFALVILMALKRLRAIYRILRES